MKNALWATFGTFFLVLGLIGLLLPVVPQIPFLLAAGFCFARINPAFNEWLKTLPILGKHFHKLDGWSSSAQSDNGTEQRDSEEQ